MKTLDKLIELNEILKDIDESLYIAGGALRDVIAQEEPKDVDIFMVDTQKDYFLYETVKNIKKDLKNLEGIIENVEYAQFDSEKDFYAVSIKFEYKGLQCTIINPEFITGNTIEEVVEDFDFDINSLYLDLFNRISTVYPYNYYDLDTKIQNKEATYNVNNSKQYRKAERIQAYKQKGYKINE